jgi:FkbM family methyltransferase
MRDLETAGPVAAVARRTVKTIRRYSGGLHELATNRNGRRVPMLRRRAFDLARAVTPVVAVDSGGISYFVSTADRSIGRELFALRQFDEQVMERAMEVVGRHLGAPPGRPLAGKVFVDVGANIGTATIPALLRYGAAGAIAFEPDERCFRLLRHNVIENDLGNDLAGRVTTVRAAVWDEPGTASFEIVDSNWGDSRVRSASPSGSPPAPAGLAGASQEPPAPGAPGLQPGTAHSPRKASGQGSLGPLGSFGEEQRATTEVPLVTLDGFLAERGIGAERIGLLWVDVQGAEFHVLNGARSLLEAGVPVVMEFWPYGLRRLGGLDELSSLVAEHYTSILDLRAEPDPGAADGSGSLAAPGPIPADQLGSLRPRYEADTAYTDLLLLPG